MTKPGYLIDMALIFISGLVLFTWGVGHQEIIGFESRFYLFALEMWRHGITLFPMSYNVPYPDYPVTPTLIIYGFSQLMGGVSKYSAVLPSALAAAITMTFTYLIGALHERRLGIASVIFLLLTNTFVVEARTISPDQYVAMVTAMSFYLIYSADVLQKTERRWFLPLLFFFGFACRGPIGLVIPASVVTLYYCLDKQWKPLFVFGFIALGVLLVGCGLLFGMAYVAGGTPFLQDVFRMEIWGRMQHAYLPWHFYITEGLSAYAITFPLGLLVMLGMVRSKPNPLFIKLIGWVFILLVGLSIPAGKKMRYLLAMAPPLSLICAYLFILPANASRYFLCLRQGVYWLCYLSPTICFVVASLASNKMPFVWPLFLFVGLQIATIMMRSRYLCVLVLAMCAYVSTCIFIAVPMNLALNHTRDTVTHIETMRQKAGARLVFYNQNPDGLPIKYLVNMTKEEKPLFMEHPHDAIELHQPAFFITDLATFKAVPKAKINHFKVISFTRIGRVDVLVFTVV